MVILFVAPFYETKGEMPKGGLNMYLRRVTGAMKKFGHVPIIISLGARDIHYIENDMEVFFVQCPHIWSGNAKFDHICDLAHKSIVMNHKIAELLKKRRIDIIQFPSIWGLAAFYYGRTPAVMRMSAYTKFYGRDYGGDKSEVDVRAFFERAASRRCNAVFAPSTVIADAFAQDIHRPVSVIESPFWNEVKAFDDSVYREALNGKKYFLFCGRLVENKGILVIAEILQSFLQSNPEYYFVCCGIASSGTRNLVKILHKEAGPYKDRFIYMESLPHSQLYPIMQHADFVVCPSLIENFSNVCLEAMYFRCVVIGTDGASYEQLIDDGINGMLCKPGDAEGLLKKMREAAAMSKDEKEKMGRMARRRIDKLAPEYVVKKLIRYYQYIIDNRNK